MIEEDTMPEAWLSSLKLFNDGSRLSRFESDRGPCIERQDVLITVRQAASDPLVAGAYPSSFAPLVDGVSAAFKGIGTSANSTLAQRLYAWPRRTGRSTETPKTLDQVALMRDMLHKRPDSRFVLAAFWDPDVDPFLPNPVSPLHASFRVRSGVLNGTLSARSVDAWMGAFPMFVGFIQLLRELAKMCGHSPGTATFFVLSYHLYEIDFPVAMDLIR
jgi:hypothetical protein